MANDLLPPSPDRIKGNASDAAKRVLCDVSAFFRRHPESRTLPVYGDSVLKRAVVTEVNIDRTREDKEKKEAVVIVELEVTEDMTNAGNHIHGGCTAFLVDCLTTLVLAAYSVHVGDDFFVGVSQTINIVYHSPAVVGDKLRIANYTVAGGARAKTARCEIWNATHHRLVASGLHIKMNPSRPKSKL